MIERLPSREKIKLHNVRTAQLRLMQIIIYLLFIFILFLFFLGGGGRRNCLCRFFKKCNEETSLLNDNMDKIRNPHCSENTHPQAKKDNSHMTDFFSKN